MKMRIVGMCSNIDLIFIQTTTDGKNWKQVKLKGKEFETFMIGHFKAYYALFVNMGAGSDIKNFFYHFGENEEMRAKGDAYEFESGVNYEDIINIH